MQNKIDVKIQKLNSKVKTPFYATDGAAGCDVYVFLSENAATKTDENGHLFVEVSPNQTTIIPTGIKVAIPFGFEIQVRPRSGLSLKSKLRIANSPGTIDSDFRGEIGIIIENISNEVIKIKNGDRIAQLVLAPVFQASFIESDSLEDTSRGEGGFGSTGKN